MKQTLKKHERLHGKKTIETLFSQGNSFFSHPFIVYYQTVPSAVFQPACATLFSISKKKIRLATQRNLLKRRMRETFRKNKHLFHNLLTTHPCNLHIAFIYISNDILDYATIEKKMLQAFESIINTPQIC
jgi:ribonuclease P protein component